MLKSRLIPEIADKLTTDHVFVAELASKIGVSALTIQNWRRNGDPQLTLPVAVDLIKKHLDIPKSETITEIYETEPKFSTIN